MSAMCYIPFHVITEPDIAEIFEEDMARFGGCMLVRVPMPDTYGHAEPPEEVRSECSRFWVSLRSALSR